MKVNARGAFFQNQVGSIFNTMK